MYQVNPMQLVQMIKNGQNPQYLLLSILENQFSATPMGQNLLQLAKGNKTADIEQIARNLCQSKGLDCEREFNAFKKQLGL